MLDSCNPPSPSGRSPRRGRPGGPCTDLAEGLNFLPSRSPETAMKRRFVVGACTVFAAAGICSAAGAAPKPAPTNAPVVQAVVDCRKIEDSAQRLACYDASVDA